MGAKHSTRTKSKSKIDTTEDKTAVDDIAEDLIGQYQERLRELEPSDISVVSLSLEEIQNLREELRSEMNTLDRGEMASKVPKQIRASIKEQYKMYLEQYNTLREVHSFNELITKLTKLKAPMYKGVEASLENQITTAREELEKLKSNIIINSFLKQDLIHQIETELHRLDREVIDLLLSQISPELRASIEEQGITTVEQCRDIVRCYELLIELTQLKAPIYKRDAAPFGRQITTARQALEEVKSNTVIGSFLKQDLIHQIETELHRLYREVIDLLLPQVSPELRASIEEQGITTVEHCKYTVRCYELLTELTKLKAPIYKRDEAPFEGQITTARQELEEVKSNTAIDSFLKQMIITIMETELQRLDKEFTDQFLNVEVRDSIDLIEKTLEEPHFYSLPHLIMWRDTAQEKIQKLNNFPIPLPEELVLSLVKKYESLIIQLRAEILKLRTYPIPEPWSSHCMRQELTHLIKGEFVFFVHPRIEEEMRPLILSERDTLPGGLTRREYDSRMNRLKRESVLVIAELKERNAYDMEKKLKWFKDSFAEIEKDLNFAFTELAFLYKDGRSLDYLVDKNQDDALLKEIYETLLRRVRHYFNNRIHIPSVGIDHHNEPMLVAPPKSERNIPIASGVDRGATEGLQLVTPASVVVVNKTVFVADKCGHLVTCYRASDLEALAWYHLETNETPVSLTVFNCFLFVCYSNKFVKYRLSWKDEFHVKRIQFERSIEKPQISCTASNELNLFVGTLKPSLILIDAYTLRIQHEYPLNPIRYHNNKSNRYPWLQDMKVGWNWVICLFTGSPSPLQQFSLKGEFLRTILTEDQIVGAYHFNLFRNPVTLKWRIFITDFWDNAIKVFDLEGQFIETFSEKGFRLGQIFHPTGIFIERSGLITVCDMKEDNCLQRL